LHEILRLFARKQLITEKYNALLEELRDREKSSIMENQRETGWIDIIYPTAPRLFSYPLRFAGANFLFERNMPPQAVEYL